MDSIENLGLTVGNKYKVEKQIGKGSFGVIYEGLDLTSGEKVAIKANNNKRQTKSSIIRESIIYRKLNKKDCEVSGIPVLHWSGPDDILGHVMVMNLFGSNLEEIFKFCGRKFSLKTKIMLSIQMLERLQTLHSLSFIHRDLKPENFVLGCGSQSRLIFIIDFGLSKSYIDRRTGQHIQYNPNAGFTGTARYCSINANSGAEQSRRDDLESIAYIIAYFNLGSLPWQGFKVSNSQKKRAILGVKQSTCAQQLFSGLGHVFDEYLCYCQQLKFKEEPNHQLWINRFREYLEQLGYELDNKFDWNIIYESLDLK